MSKSQPDDQQFCISTPYQARISNLFKWSYIMCMYYIFNGQVVLVTLHVVSPKVIRDFHQTW